MKKRAVQSFAFIALGCLASSLAVADTGLKQLVDMSKALSTSDYTGVYVHQRNGELQASKVIHAGQSGGIPRRERLIKLTGDSQEIHRNGEDVTCYFPKQRSVLIDKNAPKNPFSVAASWDLEQIANNYHVLVSKHAGRVAGRFCQKIILKPRDKFRYGYRLCIDDQTKMLLQADLVGHSGRVLEHMMFTDISFPDNIASSEFEATMDFDGVTWVHNPILKVTQPQVSYSVAGSTPKPEWHLEAVPNGFLMRLKQPAMGSRGKPQRKQMVYSDGLASVSVFIEPIQDKTPLMGLSAMGVINAYGRVVDNHQITVIGDVPKSTVRSMAMSVSYSQP
ncbi:MAG: sigma-E factor negative regulatory protein RseB [Pseudoalteromonas tetraodonis]|jgi:sigma-E factor negative regulatory protein RseB